MLYPKTAQELVDKALDGELGEKWQRTVEQNKGGFDCWKELYKCRSCGYWDVEPRKNYYVFSDSSIDRDYFAPWGDKGQCIKRYIHICPQCGKRMHRVHLPTDEEIACKKCGKPLNFDDKDLINWD